MDYYGFALSDTGIQKATNQDSACLKIANTKSHGKVVLAMVCDGMGGLESGELASAVVIKKFSQWFENDLPKLLSNYSWDNLSDMWKKTIKELNYKIMSYATKNNFRMGTTISAMLIIRDKYLIGHVGDTRIYRLSDTIEQITQDQTFIAREISRGTMTVEQAKVDPRRNMLLQCVGASKVVDPQMITGKVSPGEAYLICSDGFRHVITEQEIYTAFCPDNMTGIDVISDAISNMIETVKSRNERDNVTALLLKCE